MNSFGKTKCDKCKVYLTDFEYEDHIFYCFAPESDKSSYNHIQKSNVYENNNRKNIFENRHKKCDICHLNIESIYYDDHIYSHSLDGSNKNRGIFMNIIPNILDKIQKNPDLVTNGRNNNISLSSILNGSMIEDIISPNKYSNIMKNQMNEGDRIYSNSYNKDFNQYHPQQNKSSVSERSYLNHKDSMDFSFSNKNKHKLIFNKKNHRESNFYSYEELLKLDENNVKKSLNIKLIDELPCETMTKSILSNLSIEDKKCSICYDDFVQGDRFIRLPCFHIFHEKEIVQWFQTNKTCPICKIDIEEVLK
jgi:hypothetical protein